VRDDCTLSRCPWQGIGLVYDEPYYGAVANASIWFVFCIIFVDWAAGSPAGGWGWRWG
jgi:hypothetical protein